MAVTLYSSAVFGIEATTIAVEARVSPGLNYFIVGLPDSAVKESLFRVESAIDYCGLHMPRQKIVISMAPAGVKKQGAVFDLPVALSILAASGQLEASQLENSIFAAELSLNGQLRPVKGALSMAMQALKDGFKRIFLPAENAAEAAIVAGLEVYAFSNLGGLIEFISGKAEALPVIHETRKVFAKHTGKYELDFSDVKGQRHVKRALEIAAAGGHNAILIGPPGAGKTMLARRLPTILPPLDLYEALEATRIHSVAGTLEHEGLLAVRPFRSPHHTASDVALVGGGTHPQPGEVSLAHHGVLFLDELPEFKRCVLEVLRQPLEERQVAISRASFTANFPASFILLAAMNPCPCGYFRHPDRKCSCSPGAVRQYISRISGPLLDRIDLHIMVEPVPGLALASTVMEEKSSIVRERVSAARRTQSERLKEIPSVYCNAQLSTQMVSDFCRLRPKEQAVLQQAMQKNQLSARAYERILKVARTIADLDRQEHISLHHLAEAINFRCLDKDYFAA